MITKIPGNPPPLPIQALFELWNGLKFLLIDHGVGIVAVQKNRPGGTKRPLVLLSGFWGRSFSWRKFAGHFHNQGFPVYFPLFGAQLGDLGAMSAALARFLEEHNLQDCILVCHSLGGVVALHALPAIGNRVYKIITLATPFQGTRLAYFFSFFRSAAQLTPRSAFLKFVHGEFCAYDKVINITTRFDEIVHPLRGQRLDARADLSAGFGGHLNTFMSAFGIRFVERVITGLE